MTIPKTCEQVTQPWYMVPLTKCGKPTAYVLGQYAALCEEHAREYLKTDGYVIRRLETPQR